MENVDIVLAMGKRRYRQMPYLKLGKKFKMFLCQWGGTLVVTTAFALVGLEFEAASHAMCPKVYITQFLHAVERLELFDDIPSSHPTDQGT
jgi:hypothetical protein